ncbi:DUF1444 family protein [Peristeroidobacter soli]|uniref:DUF1444 family protein n=1 Tax=Peristeroidobacter soli TaxID=2497877 RepID=UPI00101DA154|nr:DUF1444 family protein [Peristeroidobacter soli]
MKRIFALIVCLLALGAHAAADMLSPEQFTEEFRAALAGALPGQAVKVVEPLQINVKRPDGEEATAFLDNAYNEYSGAPAAKAQVIAKYLASFVETAQGPRPLNPERIVPVVKDRAWLKNVGGSKAKSKQVIEDLNADLVVIYAEDGPQNIRYFSAEDLDKAGVQRPALRELAIANLRRLLPPPEAVKGPQISMMTAGQDYVSSLLLLDEIWNGDKLDVEGEIVIAIPTRDVLLFTGSDNKDGVKKLRELARKAHADGPYSLTDRLFVYRSGRFERF